MEQATREALDTTRALLGIAVRSMAPALEQMTLPQYRTLVLLHTHGPLRSGRLAAELGIHASTFTRTADRMARDGWIRRTENPGNRREVLIELTERARALVAEVTARRARELTRVLAPLPAAQREVVLEGFRLFSRAAADTGAARDVGALSHLGVADPPTG